jgi:hypothetical protein
MSNSLGVPNDNESVLRTCESDARTPWIRKEPDSLFGIGANEGEDDEGALVSLKGVDVVNWDIADMRDGLCELSNAPGLRVIHRQDHHVCGRGAAGAKGSGDEECRRCLVTVDEAVAAVPSRRLRSRANANMPKEGGLSGDGPTEGDFRRALGAESTGVLFDLIGVAAVVDRR